MNNHDSEVYIGFFAFVCGILLGGFCGQITFSHKIEVLKQQAIAHDYALFCPEDGIWAWKDECKSLKVGE